MTEQFADVNGIKICYDIHGDGDPVILIHGFSDRKEHWRAQVGTLSKHFKVIRMDNRGAGKSDRPDGDYTMEDYASDIAGLMDSLGIEKSHIIGHSLGGMIAQNFAILYPNRVDKLILINTIPGLKPPGESIDEAIKMYSKASELTPTNPRIWRILGETHLKREQTLKVADCFKKAISYLGNFDNTYKYRFVKNLECYSWGLLL